MSLQAGTASVDITPSNSVFLVGYPHVERMSTGVHDPLRATALVLRDGTQQVCLVSLDLLFVHHDTVRTCRERIESTLGIPPDGVMIGVTHTHSGPVSSPMLAWERDPVVPDPDPVYLEFLADRIVQAVTEAAQRAVPAEAALAHAQVYDIGGNRLGPDGPRDPEVPLLVLRSAGDHTLLGLAASVCMHPTVLHEDSTVISGDLYGAARDQLQQDEPQLHAAFFMGTAGNQSPRHVARAQTLEETARLGGLLADGIRQALDDLKEADYSSTWPLNGARETVTLIPRTFPSVGIAENHCSQALGTFERLMKSDAPRADVRTAECAWFGAEEVVTLARAQEDGSLRRWSEEYGRRELQVLRTGPLFWVAWPAEVFVEYGLALKELSDQPIAFATLANGDAQGYIVTPEADRQKTYEAQCSLFTPDSGSILVNASKALIQTLSS